MLKILVGFCCFLQIRSWRYPAIPLVTLDPYMQIFMRGNTSTTRHASHWTGAEKQIVLLARIAGQNQTYRLLGGDDGNRVELVAKQLFVDVSPTRTIFALDLDGIKANLTFAAPQFTHDLDHLSRPIAFVRIQSQVSLYLYMDISAQHAVNNCDNESIIILNQSLGKAPPQFVLSQACDLCNINWGFLTLLDVEKNLPSSAYYVGPSQTSRLHFTQFAKLPQSSLPNGTILKCKLNDSNTPVIAIATPKAVTTWNTLIGYDDIASIHYFGTNLKSLWTKKWSNLSYALTNAATQVDTIFNDCEQFDNQLLKDVHTSEYYPLYALAYRQTVAALKHVIGIDGRPWSFLKEISTNGDMNTVDVIFPSSPLLLYTNPTLLARLLAPILYYADNRTRIPFSDPYSVHQLGTYPIGNATTLDQESMPLENTSNMFLMLLALAQRNNTEGLQLIHTYASLLESWAQVLLKTAEFPANQLCTDDFAGNVTNNTNLAAKAIIALRAYADLCNIITNNSSCHTIYKNASLQYAQTWNRLAIVISQDLVHSKLSYDDTENTTWSLKYNLLFQKLLGFHNEPFTNFDQLVISELAFYKTKSLQYGVPLDYRHTYTKTDWLSWIAALALSVSKKRGEAMNNKASEFSFFFDPIQSALQNTPDRNPFTDLFYCNNASQVEATGFMARPVVGGIYATLLLSPASSP